MFCDKCGTKIDDNAVFCSKCGNPTGVSMEPTSDKNNPSNVETKIEQGNEDTTVQYTNNDTSISTEDITEFKQNKTEPNKKSKKSKFKYVAIAAIIIGALVYFLTPTVKIMYYITVEHYDDAVEYYTENIGKGECSPVLKYWIINTLDKCIENKYGMGFSDPKKAFEITNTIDKFEIDDSDIKEKISNSYNNIAKNMLDEVKSKMSDVKSVTMALQRIYDDSSTEIIKEQDLVNNIIHITYEDDDSEAYVKLNSPSSRNLYLKDNDKWKKQENIEVNYHGTDYILNGYDDTFSGDLTISDDATNLDNPAISTSEENTRYILTLEEKVDLSESSIKKFEEKWNITLTDAEREKARTNLPPLKYKIFIDKETLLPAYVTIDHTKHDIAYWDNRQELLTKYTGEDMGEYEYDEDYLSIRFENYNQLEEIVIPNRALNGEADVLVK